MPDILRRINTNKVIDLTRELVRIPSENPPGNENKISEFIKEQLTKIGIPTKILEFSKRRPSVIGIISNDNKSKSLIFNGHTDTVPVGDYSLWKHEPYEANIEGGRIYGRGASDMKGGLAAMLIAAEALIETGVNGRLVLEFVADEEVTGYGTKDLLERGYKAEYAIIGEPTELKVQIAHKGVMNLRFIVKGKSAHASMPQTGVNAICKASKLCLTLQDLQTQLSNQRHPLLGEPTLNVGVIKGGVKSNVVPDYCELIVERRLIPGETKTQALHEVDKVLNKLHNGDPSFNANYEVLHYAEPSETPLESSLVKVARECVKEVTGSDFGASGFPATCDMRFFVNQGRIPSIILGPGSLHQAHAADEYIEIDQVVKAAQIYTLIALKLLT
ncbi:MAG: M20 family metallopeptidase [Nitrososphaeria archaeon]